MSTTQTTFHDFPSSTALQQRIRELREPLDRFHPHILGCCVAIEASAARHVTSGAKRARGNWIHKKEGATSEK